jgi:hypothetical protein
MRSINKGIAGLVAGAVLSLTPLARAQERVTNVVENISSNVSLNAEWQSQSLITPSTQGSGQIEYLTEKSLDNWYDDGTTKRLEAIPNQYYQFDGWTGQTNTSANPLEFIVNEPLTNLVANFSVKRTESGTPFTWLANYGFDPEQGDSQIINNYSLWQHYQLDTNPNDSEGYFYTALEPGNIVLMNTSPKVEYGADYTESLSSANWQEYTNNVPGEIQETRIPIEMQGTRFFRGRGKRVEE